ncbi:MAG: site-specific integrase [Deltaproteobacteria bacterium]|nr:site-specific integrase [Deltaproteobacteria bacterium]
MVDFHLQTPTGITRVRRVSPVQSRRGASRYELQLRETLYARFWRRKDDPPDDTTPTLTRYASHYLRDLRSRGRRPSTLASIERLLRLWVLPHTATRKVDAIRTADFSAIRIAMTEAGRQPKTINNALVVLSGLVRHWHAEHDRIPRAFRVGLVKLPKCEAPYFRDEQVDALVTAARSLGRQALALLLLGVDAGLRMSETRALQWSDLILEGRPTVTVARTRDDSEEHAPKGWRSRTIPLTPRLVEALRGLPRHPHDPHVLLSRRGTPLSRRVVGLRFHKIRTAAAVEHGTYHSTRHTFCTRLAARGVPVTTIQELAGHADLATTRRYLHATPGAADAAIAALSDSPNHGTIAAPPASPIEKRPRRLPYEAV